MVFMRQSPSFFQRFLSCLRLFQHPGYAWVVSVVCMVFVALCEPMVPALLQPLLDKGFQQNSFSVWLVPLSLVGLFSIRGLGMFVGQVAVTKITQTGLLRLRMQMFERLQDACLPLFKSQNASALEAARRLAADGKLTYPVAVKTASSAIPHKTEAGCVVQNVQQAAADAGRYSPQAAAHWFVRWGIVAAYSMMQRRRMQTPTSERPTPCA